MRALLREISLRHWLRAPFRTSLMVLGIALGVALHVATETAADTIFIAFGELVERVAGRADLTVESAGVGVPNALVADIAELKGVAHAAATLELTAQAPELQESLLIMGVDMLGDLHFLPFESTEGETQVIEDPLSFVNDPTALLLSQNFAARHHLHSGDSLSLLTSEGLKPFTVRGLLQDSGPAASFGGQVAVMFLDAAQVAFGRGTFADRIDVALDKGADEVAVSAALRKQLGEGYTVETPARMGARLKQLVLPLHGALWLSGFLALLVGGFLVYNAVGVAVAQRRREIGMLRAFGVTRSATIALFCIEAALLAIPGISLGLWLGALLSDFSTGKALNALNQIYFSVPKVQTHLTPRLATISGSAGMITAVFAAFWPARKGANTDPAVVLRGTSSLEDKPLQTRNWALVGALIAGSAWLPALQSGRAGGTLSVVLSLVGAACATPALIKLIRRALLRAVELSLGVPGRLGLDYVERALGRSTVNVLALMVAVSMSVAVGGWLTSFEQSILGWADQVGIADLSVTQGSPIIDRQHLPFAQDVVQEVATVPAIEALQTYRVIDQEVSGVSLRMVATDTETFIRQAEKRGKGWQLLQGEPLRPRELAEQPLALLSENAAERLHVGVGDKLALFGPTQTLTVTVRAVIVDYTSQTGTLFIDRSLYLKGYSDPAVDGVALFLKPGADLDHTAAAIRNALGGRKGIFITRTEAVRSQIISTVRGTFSYSRAVEIVTLLIALLGIIGTMVATVIDRTRELAMLRAIGASTRQVAASIVAEATFLGLCAVLIGLVVGLVQCQLFLKTLLVGQTGFHIAFVFPWAVAARIGGLVLVTSAAAGGLPALRAARTDMASAMVYD